MKVIQLISGLRAGGAEHFVLELCRHSLNDPDVQMSVVTLSANDEISYRFRNAGIPLLTASGKARNKRVIKAFSGFFILMKHKATVIHAHMFHACAIACMVKLFRPATKIIFTLHNDHVPQLLRRWILFVTRPLRKADIVLPAIKRKWFQKNKPAVISNAIDLTRFNVHVVKPRAFTCAFVGRLSPEKNPLFLISLVKLLKDDYDFVITVAGDGPLQRAMKKKISEEKLEHYFNLHGHVENVPELLAGCHCLLIPSLWEGMPLVLLEAAASGIPVISTPTGNIPSIVNNSNGYVGALEDFHKMLAEVMDNYGDALIRARNLKQKVYEEYGIEKIYHQHKKLYWYA